ncbi:MAG TPA: EutN/CcmL family microcompartment protein [Pirellulales bacterium]|jgi:ethanolamine utilization protein EutN|nr:EutN/CcmL family microcompartment protein [Pirellulales bacterium]
MQIGLVVGTATSTVKHRSMIGTKLLVVQFYGQDGQTLDGDPVLAVDTLGAGRGERVLLSSDGRNTRALLKDETTPVRWSVLGIDDNS